MQMDDREGAAADAAEAVILDRDDPAAKALLGVTDARAEAPGGRDRLPQRGGRRAVRRTQPIARVWPRHRRPRGDADAALATLIAGIAAAPASGGVAQRRHPAVGSTARFHTADAACRGSARRRRGGRLLLRPQGHALSSLGRHAEASGCLCRGTEARSATIPMCAISWLPPAICRVRRALPSSISAPCSTAMPIASSCT